MEEAKPVENIQQPVTTPTKSTHWLLLIGIILLVAVIASVGTYYYLSQQKTAELTPIPEVKTKPTAIPTVDVYTESNRSETANWKTYINKQLGFSIKSPGDIKQYDFPGNISSYIDISLPTIPADQHKGITITWYPNTEITVQELMEDISSQRFSNAKDTSAIFKKSYYTADGKQEEMITRISSENGEARFLFIQTNKDILEFKIWYTTKYKKEALKLFDQILSTFKFTDQNQQDKFKNYGGFDPNQHPCGNGNC